MLIFANFRKHLIFSEVMWYNVFGQHCAKIDVQKRQAVFCAVLS